MRIVIAPDSFKGSLTSREVAECIKQGIAAVFPEAEAECVPIADGGEGTVEAVISAVHGSYRRVRVHGPLGIEVEATYGVFEDSAVIEMAESTGLSLVPEKDRNPMKASSLGLGEQIRDALDMGCRRIILGIGGSATNDGGMGMARALGVRFYDSSGAELECCGESAGLAAAIDMSGLDPRVGESEIIVITDVENPLFGERGASRVYGPQKGASTDMVELLDRGLEHLSRTIREQLSVDVSGLPGGGAAGGAGAGLVAFLNARLVKGIDYVLEISKLEDRIREADMVITGEGRMDSQTVYGKVPVGIAKMAKKYGKPVFAVCGSVGSGAQAVYDCGIDGILSSVTAPVKLEEALLNSRDNVRNAAENLFRIVKALR